MGNELMRRDFLKKAGSISCLGTLGLAASNLPHGLSILAVFRSLAQYPKLPERIWSSCLSGHGKG